MAARRSSASTSDTTTSDALLPTRRGAARFARVLVEPTRAAALLARSPVNPDAAAAVVVGTPTAPARPGSTHHHLHHARSTPQPVRRTLFARLFRMKTRDDESGASVSAAASPASHQSTPTHHHDGHYETASTTAASSADQQENGCHGAGFARTVSMPYHRTRPVATTESVAGTAPTTREDPVVVPRTRVLLDGPLVKLSSHKYWHARATYFVLDEATSSSDARSRVWLCQFRKKPSHHNADKDDAVPLMEIELSEFDVVVDISDRYIKHGLELFHRSAVVSGRQTQDEEPTAIPAQGELYSLRLSVENAAMHRTWMRVLGSAIARLVDQSKRHYPITPADVEFSRGALKAFEPSAVTAIVGTSIAGKASAKVRPMVNHSSSSSDDEADGAEENQGEVMVDLGDSVREDEMRTPEEPETHSDCDELNGERFSVVSNGFSDAWASPHHHNNNHHRDSGEYGHIDEGYQERSSNQLEDHDDEDQQLAAHAQRLSECNSSSGYIDVAAIASHMTEPSPTGTSSVASTPSPRNGHSVSSTRQDVGDDADIANAAVAFAAASLVEDGVVATPPTTPPRYLSKPRHHPLGSTSRLASAMRPQVHSFNANGQVFTLDVRYRLVKSIGTGAYGAVIAASDSVADMSVAVKKITNIFDDLVDAKRILREVRLLRHFHHKNITQLLDLAPPNSKKSFEDMYIITELMETDLHQVIYSMQPMSDDHVKYFLYQMLCALYHIHSAGVLHRDMKPSNILLNSNCDLKVCDFGLARGGMDADSDARRLGQPGDLTEYVVTRWYRAPEIMLNCLQYTAAIDVWAVGCIFAEMLLREPLFPGNDYMHQLKLIIKFLGTPKQEDTAFIKNVKALRFLTKLSISKPKKWREVFTGEDLNPLALDLLAQMLIFNPEKRISVERALQHPYLATFYDPADITRASPFSFAFDLPDDKLTKEALVDLLCEDVECFHPALMQAMKEPPPTLTVPMPMLPRPPVVATNNGGNRYFGTTASAS